MRKGREIIVRSASAVFIAAASLVTLPALAQDIRTSSGLSETANVAGVPKAGNIPKLAGVVITAMFQFMGVLFLILMIYAGFLWMTAQGSEEKIKKAKNLITGAVIGIIITVSAYAITGYVIDSLISQAT